MSAAVVAASAAAPGAITDLAAVAGDARVALVWSVPSDGGSAILGFQVRRRESGAAWGSWADISGSGPTTASHTVTGLRNGTAYDFQVRAVNAVDPAEVSNTATAAPVAPAPVRPVPVRPVPSVPPISFAVPVPDPVPPPEPTAAEKRYFSGPVTGPGYCANLSLGGARTFAFDSDGDGVADVCSLPYTRREAVARQNAADALAQARSLQYRLLLQDACRALGDAYYGDQPHHLQQDTCHQ